MEILQCVDVVVLKGDRIVYIERLSEPRGLALVGGHVEDGETPEQCVARELHEETGLTLLCLQKVRKFTDPNRDTRGGKQRESTLFVATAVGNIIDEEGKTRVCVGTYEELRDRYKGFVLDHWSMIQEARERKFI